MDSKRKAEWVKALRSGDYAQGKSRLRTSGGAGKDKFCCLGVLCDIVKPELWHKPDKTAWRYDGSTDLLPYDLRKEVGIDSRNQFLLARMNDVGDKFSVIADWIEENL